MTTCLSRMHSADEQGMTLNFRAVKADSVLDRIATDEGLTGIAEPSPYGAPPLIAENVAKLAPEIMGLHVVAAASFVRTSPGLRAGITGAMRIAHTADSFRLRAEVAGGGPVNVHLCMAISNSTYYESLVTSNRVVPDP